MSSDFNRRVALRAMMNKILIRSFPSSLLGNARPGCSASRLGWMATNMTPPYVKTILSFRSLDESRSRFSKKFVPKQELWNEKMRPELTPRTECFPC